jgi:regulator of nucleoside diphosphate kinase
MHRSLIINRLDQERLAPHLEMVRDFRPADIVRNTLARARPVSPVEVPPDVITMNSRVSVRYPNADDIDTYVLSYPDEADERSVSVLSPLGSALFAAREGQEITFMGARTLRSVVVQHIDYQPEREGRFDL